MSDRVKISIELADLLLFESDRTCCVCTIFNKPVQIHHIDENSSNNLYENLIVLCLECHSNAHTSGGFGRGFSIGQLKKYKEEWVARVKFRKDEADKLASIYTVTGQKHSNTLTQDDLEYKTVEEYDLLQMYLQKLILIHKGQQLIAQADWDTGRTFDMIHGSTKMIDFYEAVLVELSTFYPKGHFDEKHPKIFFSEQVASRISFYASISDPYKTLGSIERASIGYRVSEDLKRMVADMAGSLIESCLELNEEEFNDWSKKWMGEPEL